MLIFYVATVPEYPVVEHARHNSRDSAREDKTGQGSCSDREWRSPACPKSKGAASEHHFIQCHTPYLQENGCDRKSPGVGNKQGYPDPPDRLLTHTSSREGGSVLKDLVAFNVNPGDEDPFQIRNQVLHRMVAESRIFFKASLHDAVVRERRMIFQGGRRCTDGEDL